MRPVYKLDACPSCHSDWRGEPIVPELREHFGGAAYTTRIIAWAEHDEVIAYACPDCEARFPVASKTEREAA